jgi:hypothetical protein
VVAAGAGRRRTALEAETGELEPAERAPVEDEREDDREEEAGRVAPEAPPVVAELVPDEREVAHRSAVSSR